MSSTRGTHLPTVVAGLMLACAVIASFLAASGPVQWMDNGLMLADAAQGPFFSSSLGPVSHPFYALIARVIHALLGMHLLSLLNAILLLPLAMVVHGLAVSVGTPRHLALLAATATVLAHAVFWASTKAEPYVLHALLIIGAYWLCFAAPARLGATGRLLAIGALSGLALAIHPLTLVVLLPLYVQLAVQHKLRLLLVLPGIALGFAPAWPAVINDLNTGMSLFDITRRYLAGPDQLAIIAGGRNDTLWRFDDLWHEKNAVVLLALSLIGPQMLGLTLWPKTRALQVLWAALLLNFLFAVSYGVFDRFTLFLPGIALASILGVVHLARYLTGGRIGTAVVYLSVLAGPVAMLSMWGLYANGWVKLPTHTEALPFRNDIRYYLVPYLQDRSAHQFARTYETLVPPGALVVADTTPLGALRSAQANGALRGRILQGCEQSTNIPPYLNGAGAFLPRTSFCGNIGEQYRLQENLLGFRLQAK
ncbi:DUF2723 domain-containing protein [Pseudomonas sp. CFBP 8771]|uniref:DUF2723 domain-containing protein n=1 Tax=Pseudomonas sp. CFBP 8771 TaxID=2775285 RepID=UPI00177C9091|nr:DUF2723 domain-containing protein [Pseudomonas sp. CFBP 8771]MBD8605028.1 DUF2723 domain-containing protein [Pseudomonas sp. CFBP 8771]